MYITIFQNSITQYFLSICLFIALFIVYFIIKKIFLQRISKKINRLGFVSKNIIPLYSNFNFIIYYSFFFVSIRILVLPETVHTILSSVWILLITISIIRSISYALFAWLNNRAGSNGINVFNPKMFSPFISVLLWGIGGIFILDNFGFKISSIVTGLGIGGIAIAIASQNILGDLLSYVSLVFDRPFEPDDFIILENYMGCIEKIGLRTTRIRSLSGELIVIPNSDIVKSRVRNYKKMEQRRVVFELSITYGTDTDKIIQLCEFIKNSILSIKNSKFDRSHFKSFGNSALLIETVYYVLSSDYTVYMDIQQKINLMIYDFCNTNDIEFAFPTQTISIKNN
ncbi:MAG: hypothetical protein A2015_17585 [Spirochaetes bacterium GWF1_31_7]|nr:MAG: hypothetical protein A2Y30_05575 [Spirochaetes bacterium GWE1_32_154]OHD47291.1 MAG: hypothetical protein A2015_17585 [Spirochaetes bacterium GWF1_31_7]OHD49539.1 MAG: hypothetical protein A2Y29_01635 [Spirochaetes bacterium GWE2_31_10]